jgi:protein subunit release factor A
MMCVIRVYDFERKRLQASRDEQRHAAGGTGDRSDKIRTYNFPQVQYIC